MVAGVSLEHAAHLLYRTRLYSRLDDGLLNRLNGNRQGIVHNAPDPPGGQPKTPPVGMIPRCPSSAEGSESSTLFHVTAC